MLTNEECLINKKEVLFEESKHSLDQFISGLLHLADLINVSTGTNNLLLKVFSNAKVKQKTLIFWVNPTVWHFDFKIQIKYILEKYQTEILIYKGEFFLLSSVDVKPFLFNFSEKLNKTKPIIDVLNAKFSKNLDKNSISLVLFKNEAEIEKGLCFPWHDSRFTPNYS